MKNSIYHYGVKGMRWGIRRTPTQLGRRNHKRLSDMTDEELNKKINRYEKERRYKDLVTPTYIKAGKKIVNTILLASTIDFAKGQATKAMNKHLSSYTDKYVEAGIKAVSTLLDKPKLTLKD